MRREMLNGKVIVVTGGAGLLGREFATSISENGGLAVIADVDIERAQSVAQEIGSQEGGQVDAERLDITNPESVDQLIDAMHERHGRIDAVVNNAYPRTKDYGRRFEDVTYESFCGNLSMHLGGYFLVAQRFSDYFRKQGQGNIVNMSSIYGFMAPRFDVYEGTSMTMPVEYAAIKSAILGLTRYMAQYLKGTGIRVNAISPGGIEDGQPKEFLSRYADYCQGKGMLDAADLNGSLLFLLSDASRHITGQNLVVDDGYSL